MSRRQLPARPSDFQARRGARDREVRPLKQFAMLAKKQCSDTMIPIFWYFITLPDNVIPFIRAVYPIRPQVTLWVIGIKHSYDDDSQSDDASAVGFFENIETNSGYCVGDCYVSLPDSSVTSR
jgi:hypothetical protein